ncbi:MAG: VTT domain-containing protein [Clostridia bacterium]|nr:VTT domain-containing protein [Clostridia bacterium]
MNAELIADFLNQFGIYAFAISIAVSVLIAISGILPSFLVTAANILVFGPIKGFIVSWLGESIGAMIAFYIYRFGFRGKAQLLGNKYSLINKLVQSKGIYAGLLVLQGRLLPFIPSGFVTAAASVSQISPIHFMFWTALGKVPSLLLESLATFDLIHLRSNYARLSVTIALVTFSNLLYRYLIKRNR